MTDMFELTLAIAGSLFVRTMSIRTLILEEENTRRTKNRLSNTAFPFSVLFSFFSQLQLVDDDSIVILLSYGFTSFLSFNRLLLRSLEIDVEEEGER